MISSFLFFEWLCLCTGKILKKMIKSKLKFYLVPTLIWRKLIPWCQKNGTFTGNFEECNLLGKGLFLDSGFDLHQANARIFMLAMLILDTFEVGRGDHSTFDISGFLPYFFAFAHMNLFPFLKIIILLLLSPWNIFYCRFCLKLHWFQFLSAFFLYKDGIGRTLIPLEKGLENGQRFFFKLIKKYADPLIRPLTPSKIPDKLD
jgi:hypothetical protein